MTPNYQRFIDLIRVVEKVPPAKLNMTEIIPHDGCGCAVFHARKAGVRISGNWERSFGMDVWHPFGGFNYPNPRGNAAKIEMLRRIREVLGLPKREALKPKP